MPHGHFSSFISWTSRSSLNPFGLLSVQQRSSCSRQLGSFTLIVMKMFESRALKFSTHLFVFLVFPFLFCFQERSKRTTMLDSDALEEAMRAGEAVFPLQLGCSWPCSSQASKRNHHFLPQPHCQLYRQLC